jgi:hypothetical protein
MVRTIIIVSRMGSSLFGFNLYLISKYSFRINLHSSQFIEMPSDRRGHIITAEMMEMMSPIARKINIARARFRRLTGPFPKARNSMTTSPAIGRLIRSSHPKYPKVLIGAYLLPLGGDVSARAVYGAAARAL